MGSAAVSFYSDMCLSLQPPTDATRNEKPAGVELPETEATQPESVGPANSSIGIERYDWINRDSYNDPSRDPLYRIPPEEMQLLLSTFLLYDTQMEEEQEWGGDGSEERWIGKVKPRDLETILRRLECPKDLIEMNLEDMFPPPGGFWSIKDFIELYIPCRESSRP